jgi:hypothetical protein
LEIENTSNSSSDFVLAIDADNISLLGSNGTAGIVVDKQNNRTGSLLNISDLPGKSVLNMILNIDKHETNGSLIAIVKSPSGYTLLNRNLPSLYIIGRDRLISLIMNSIVVFIFIFAGNAYINARLRGVGKRIEKTQKQAEDLGSLVNDSKSEVNVLKSEIDLLNVRVAKRKILYARTLREARVEIDFWRSIFRDVLTRSGLVTKQDSNRLLHSLTRRLGFGQDQTIQDFDVAEIVELLIDDNNDRIKSLVRQIKSDSSDDV